MTEPARVLVVCGQPIWTGALRESLNDEAVVLDEVTDLDAGFGMLFTLPYDAAVVHLDSLAEDPEAIAAHFDTLGEGWAARLMMVSNRAEGARVCTTEVSAVSATLLDRLAPRDVERGRTGDGSFEELIERLAASEASGMLVTRHDACVGKVLLRRGVIALYASNLPQDRVGQICLARDLVTPEELATAVSMQRTSRERLGQLLQRVRQEPIDVELALIEHAREAMIELFLWKDGEWMFYPETDPEPGEEIGTTLAELLPLARQAQEEWSHIQDLDWLEAETRVRKMGDVDERDAEGSALLNALQEPTRIESLRLELRWSCYRAFRVAARLVEEGRLAVEGRGPSSSPPPGPLFPAAPARPTQPADYDTLVDMATDGPIEEAEDALRAGDLTRARELALQVLSLDMTHGDSRRLLDELDRTQRERATNVGLEEETRVTLARPMHQLSAQLSPEAAFVLSRPDIPSSVSELVAICPLNETDILAILEQALSEGLIRVEG